MNRGLGHDSISRNKVTFVSPRAGRGVSRKGKVLAVKFEPIAGGLRRVFFYGLRESLLGDRRLLPPDRFSKVR